MVLATDMALHTKHVSQLKAKVGTKSIDLDDFGQCKFVLGLMVHMADVSNPVKPWGVYTKWTSRIMEEFYAQVRVSE